MPRTYLIDQNLAERMGTALQPYRQQIAEAERGALGAALSSSRGGQPFAAQRSAQEMAARTTAPIHARAAEAGHQMRLAEEARIRAEADRRREEMRQLTGGLIGGAGSVIGTLIPGFGQMGGGGLAGGVGSALGGAMGGGASATGGLVDRQAQLVRGGGDAAQTAPPGAAQSQGPPGFVWDPARGWVRPVGAGGLGLGLLGGPMAGIGGWR